MAWRTRQTGPETGPITRHGGNRLRSPSGFATIPQALAGALTLLCLTLGITRAEEQLQPSGSPTPNDFRLFETAVRPVLATQCVKCHGSEKQESGLRLDSWEAMIKGGDSGPAVVPGKPEESLLIEAIRYDSYEMPPDEQLPDPEIAGIVQWVESGASWPPDLTLKMRNRPVEITDEDRAHWSFQPVTDPPLPVVTNAAWCRSKIDRFVLHKLEREGLTPAQEAKTVNLLRRAYYDLIGLPPTPEQIDAYLADTSPEKYARLIDQLLDDPRYGEKWAPPLARRCSLCRK